MKKLIVVILIFSGCAAPIALQNQKGESVEVSQADLLKALLEANHKIVDRIDQLEKKVR